jgi:PAS domain S-box-containing protein
MNAPMPSDDITLLAPFDNRWFGSKGLVGLWIGAGLAIALSLANVILTVSNTRQLDRGAAWVSHTYEVMTSLQSVLSIAKDAETGQRGYLITGDPRYLEPYRTAIQEIDRELAQAQQLTSDNQRQRGRLPELRDAISAKLKELDQTIQLRDARGFNAARELMATDRGKTEMDAIRATVTDMIRHEQDLLQARSLASQRMYRTSVASGLASGFAAIVAILALLVLLRKHLAARSRAAFVIAEQGERFRTTLASIGDAVITTDTEGRVTNLNAVAESLTGWNRAEAVNQPLGVVFRIVNEETRRTVENPAARALREGTIVGLANHTVLLSRQGGEHPIDDSAAPIRCAQGEVVGCVLVFRDMSERKRAEEALRASEERLRLALSADKGMGWWDMDLRTGDAVWSESYFSILGYVGSAAAGASYDSWRNRLHPEDREQVLSAVEQARWQRSLFSLEYRISRADTGEAVWLSPFGQFHYDSTGEAVRFVGVCFDITERKRTEEELRHLAAELSEADHRKDEFLGVLAHELRNPLAPLRNGLQIIRLSNDNGDLLEQARSMMERQLAHLVRLVDDLLDVSRISRGRLELRKERVELNLILSNAIETSRPVIDAAGHTLTVNISTKPIYVDADVVRLAQVFANLLNNAAKYTESGGLVSLTAERHGSHAVVSVRDSGIGIPAEMLPRIFDMFTQVDRSLERSQGGLGIGLTLAKRLVEMHDGTIEAHADGRGSQFIVRLPVLVGDVHDATRTQSRSENQAGSHRRRRILVADDNDDSARSLALMLGIMGHEVHTVRDGLEALEGATQFEPEFAFLDIGMPKLNGYEVARRVRQQPSGRSMVLVALTGWGQDEDRQRSQEAGFDYHIVKPVEPIMLEELLAKSKSAGRP